MDYSCDYPKLSGKILGHVSFEDLYSGEIVLNGKRIKTFSLSSRKLGEEIAVELKKRIERRGFILEIENGIPHRVRQVVNGVVKGPYHLPSETVLKKQARLRSCM